MKHTLESIHARCIPAEGDCLIWQGATTTGKGRPLPNIKHNNGTNGSGRKLVMELARKRKPSPQHTLVVHTCGNRLCLNPDHLRWATVSEVRQQAALNRPADLLRIRRIASTSRAARSRITWEQAQTIRASTEPLTKMSQLYGISVATASNIRRGITWRDYTTPFTGLGARPGHAPGARA